MGALLLLLVVTNLAAVGVVCWLLLRPPADRPDTLVADAIERMTGAASGSRRIVSLEILNPLELAGARGRVASIAGSLAPSLITRVVVDQAVKQLKRDLRAQGVVADVRLHHIRPGLLSRPADAGVPQVPAASLSVAGAPAETVTLRSRPGPVYFDEIRRLDLDEEYPLPR